jgi:hypothetical protein
MFTHLKRLIGRGISPAALVKECENFLEIVLNDREHLEKFASVRILNGDTNRVVDWKSYFYSDFKVNINSPSRRQQWLNLRKMFIRGIETTITYEKLFSTEFSEKDSEQLLEEYMKNIKISEIGTIEEFKQFISAQFVLSEISMILLRNLLSKCFKDFSDYLDFYVRLYSNMMEQVYKIRLKRKTSADTTADQILANHTARMVAGVRKRISEGEPWAFSNGGIPLADEKDIPNIFKF